MERLLYPKKVGSFVVSWSGYLTRQTSKLASIACLTFEVRTKIQLM